MIEDGENAATLIWPSKPSGHEQSQTGVFLQITDHALMAKAAQRAFRNDLGRWLLSEHTGRFAGFSQAQVRALTRHVVQQAERLGCTTKDDMVYLCHIMLSTGGWFHLTGVLPRIGTMFGAPQIPSHGRLAEAFMHDSGETAKAGLLARWGDLHAHINALPADEQMTPVQFRTVLKRFLTDRFDAVDRALQAAKSELPTLALSETQSGKLLLLTLILGYRFYLDPTLPWIALSPDQAVDAAWEATFVWVANLRKMYDGNQTKTETRKQCPECNVHCARDARPTLDGCRRNGTDAQTNRRPAKHNATRCFACTGRTYGTNGRCGAMLSGCRYI